MEPIHRTQILRLGGSPVPTLKRRPGAARSVVNDGTHQDHSWSPAAGAEPRIHPRTNTRRPGCFINDPTVTVH